MERFNPIEITNMILPAQVVMIWTLEYMISDNILIEFATAELIQKEHVNPEEWNYFFYLPYRAEQPQARKFKMAAQIKNAFIRTEIIPSSVKTQRKNINDGYHIIVESPDSFKVIFIEGTIRYQFHFIPHAITGDL